MLAMGLAREMPGSRYLELLAFGPVETSAELVRSLPAKQEFGKRHGPLRPFRR
jgi:hypothetical protein